MRAQKSRDFQHDNLLYSSHFISENKTKLQVLIALTGREARRPERRVELGGEDVDERHGHEHEGQAEQAAAQGHENDRRVEHEICERPYRHLADFGKLNIGNFFIFRYSYFKEIVWQIIRLTEGSIDRPRVRLHVLNSKSLLSNFLFSSEFGTVSR